MSEYPSELYQTSSEFEKHVSLDGDAKEALETALEAAYRLGLTAAHARIFALKAVAREAEKQLRRAADFTRTPQAHIEFLNAANMLLAALQEPE